MSDSKYVQMREPFEQTEEWTTENGTTIQVGESCLVKPKYVSRRLNAVVSKIYWRPTVLPTEKEGDKYKCMLTAVFELQPESEQYKHLDGDRVLVEAFNLDFCVGSGKEILRDRSNCNAPKQ